MPQQSSGTIRLQLWFWFKSATMQMRDISVFNQVHSCDYHIAVEEYFLLMCWIWVDLVQVFSTCSQLGTTRSESAYLAEDQESRCWLKATIAYCVYFVSVLNEAMWLGAIVMTPESTTIISSSYSYCLYSASVHPTNARFERQSDSFVSIREFKCAHCMFNRQLHTYSAWL